MDNGILDIFFPYQKRYLADKSKVKIFEKSRRIGGTWIQSFEDVQDCIEQPGLHVYFSSADLTAAAEYIDYCDTWIQKLNGLAKAMVELYNSDLSMIEFADEDKGVKSKIIEFLNGSKIIVLSSNPKAFRSKGGKIVWDEAAHHDNDEKMWAAAKPAAMWGYPIRILSTHNGVNSLFNRLITKVKNGDLDYSIHKIDIFLAVKEGLADKICGRKLSNKEREQWIEAERKGCLTEAIWQEEYCCNPQDEGKALLSYDIIHSCEREDIIGLEKAKGPLFVGMDVARHRHLSVIYVLEQQGSTLITRKVIAMQNQKWRYQERELYSILKLPNVIRACLDKTGLGDQLCERAQERFGTYKVEGVTFTGSVKEALAITLQTEFQEQTTLIPKNPKFSDIEGSKRDEQLDSLHAIRKTVTISGNSRYDAQSTENGHGDFFWALGLAVHAARTNSSGEPFVESGNPFGSISKDSIDITNFATFNFKDFK